MWTLPFTGTSFFGTWIVLGPSAGRIYGESEGVFKVITEFLEAIGMLSGRIYGIYQALLCGQGLSSKVMGGRCIVGLPQSAVNGLLKQS